jgi:hypothetical protein
MKNIDIQSEIMDILIPNLREIPSIRNLDWSQVETDSGTNPVINVETTGDSFRLLLEIRDNGQPRYARDAVARLVYKSGQMADSVYPVFAAPFISEAAARICNQTGVGYADLAGNCRLAFDGIYMERQGRPNRFVTRRSQRSLYRSRSSRVLRALLFAPSLKWKLADLSAAAGVSIGQAFNVKKALLDREWATFNKEGLHLVQPEKLLRDWGARYIHDNNTFIEFYSAAAPPDIESRLARHFSEKEVRFAFTSFSAYARLVPGAEHTCVYAYVDDAVRQQLDPRDFKSVTSGSNLILLSPYDDGVFFGVRDIGGIPVVSPIQAYLDLVGTDDAGARAAEEIFGQIIQNEWHPVTKA